MYLLDLYKSHHMRAVVFTILAVMLTGCSGTDQPFEYIHLPGTEPSAGANMPFTSAIQVRSGNIVFLSLSLIHI